MDNRRFEQGLSFSSYLDQMAEARREDFVASYQMVKLSKDDLQDLAVVRAPLHVVAFTEDWCEDCRINLPVMAKLSELASSLKLRCFSREANLDLAAELAVQRIPTFIILNSNFQEVGRWIERPSGVADLLARGNENERKLARIAYDQGRFHSDTIEEILDILHG